MSNHDRIAEQDQIVGLSSLDRFSIQREPHCQNHTEVIELLGSSSRAATARAWLRAGRLGASPSDSRCTP